jgi:hypothetical protein
MALVFIHIFPALIGEEFTSGLEQQKDINEIAQLLVLHVKLLIDVFVAVIIIITATLIAIFYPDL